MVKSLGRIATLMAGTLIVVSLGGCALKHANANLVNGKQLFATNCGSCHTLSHANTTGTVGPNLDDAFRQDRIDGVKSTSIEGLVDYWIQYPNTQGKMPAMLVKGQDAQDVASYVGLVAALPGLDTGALASAVAQKVSPTPAVGKTIFTGVGSCGSCHTLSAAGTTGTVGPNLDTLKAACAAPASQTGPRRDAAEVHRDRDHPPLRLHTARVRRRDHAEHVLQDAQPQPDPGAGGVPVEHGEIARFGYRPPVPGRARYANYLRLSTWINRHSRTTGVGVTSCSRGACASRHGLLPAPGVTSYACWGPGARSRPR